MSAYLQSSSMVATSNTTSLAAQVLGFDIIELWSHDSRGVAVCTYIHAADELLARFKDIISGPYPSRKDVKHTISPKLYEIASKDALRYYWHTLDAEEVKARKTANVASFYSNVQTELAYILQREATDATVYIVGFSLAKIECSPQKLEFLSGLGYAIFVAAFDLDDKDPQLSESKAAELDKKEVIRDPSKLFTSSLNLTGLDQKSSSDSLAGSATSDVGMPLDLESPPLSPAKPTTKPANALPRNGSQDNVVKMGAVYTPSMPPLGEGVTWDSAEFSFPIHNIPVKNIVPDNLTLDSFKEVKHLADGSNANIFTALFKGVLVIIKMIKKDVQFDAVALHEFDAEQAILSRVAHTNIVKILGSGRSPRRFAVLEYLSGGSLTSVLNENTGRTSFARVFFRKPTFTYEALLTRAKEIAESLDYLHARCHSGGTIIHRDLKPDNVGFTADGTLKLFDLGLCTCVKRRADVRSTYDMTGNTGSLRYMAPEVALRKPYNEKVDVYSFGIMIWQMATDRVPFKGMNRDQFMSDVVIGKLRPKLDSSWPAGFCNLLTACWHNNHEARPSFSAIVIDINSLIGDTGARKRGKAIRPDIERTNSSGKAPSSSSWF